MSMTHDRAEAFKQSVEEKIETILDEFASGDISREHFDIVYGRYSRQLVIAEQAIESDNLDNLNQVMNELPTMALHAAVRGKAMRMSIIHHIQMDILRTFGEYEIDDAHIATVITELQQRLDRGETEYTNVQKLYGNTWMIVCTQEKSTLVTFFRNEPSAKQVQELERRHHDFESANRNILNQAHPDPETLVYPVELFVSRSE